MGNNIPKESAKKAGLRYVGDDNLCYKRIKKGKGFTYVDEEGNQIKDEKLLDRFKSLVIPPAWKDVKICNLQNGHIQATGRDVKGRKQYIYHERWEEIRSETKFHRMYEFGLKLPEVRKKIYSDLKKRSLPREKVLALIITLLEETLIRIGNEEYAKENKSYGLTTMLDKHFEMEGSKLLFVFNGKSGKEAEVSMADNRLAKMVKACQDIPGQQLFQYIDDEGKRQPVSSGDVNDYLQEITGTDFTAKDFRTWGGTIIAAEILYELDDFETPEEGEKNIVRAIKTVAKALNNTTAICKKYYVHPAVINAYLQGTLTEEMKKAEKRLGNKNIRREKFDIEESAVLSILKKENMKKKIKKVS